MLLDLLGELESIHIGHLDIGHHQRYLVGVFYQQIPGDDAVFSFQNVETLFFNGCLDLTAEETGVLGKEDGMKGFMMGKIKLSGDLNLAMKLTSFFKIG